MSSNKGKNTTLSIGEKYEIVQMLQNGKKQHEVVNEKGVDKTVVWRIWKNREDIEEKFRSGKEKCRKFKQPQMLELESALFNWIQRMQAKGIHIRSVDCMTQANEFAKGLGSPNWQCSYGWFGRFKKRNQVLLDRAGSDVEDDDDNLEKRDRKQDYEKAGGSKKIEFDEADAVLAEILEGREEPQRTIRERSHSNSNPAGSSGFENFLEVDFKEEPGQYPGTAEDAEQMGGYQFPEGVLQPSNSDDEESMSNDEESRNSLGASSHTGTGARRGMKRPRSGNDSYFSNSLHNGHDPLSKIKEKKLLLEVELLELEKYKRKLEILKLERDLGISPSHVTLGLAK